MQPGPPAILGDQLIKMGEIDRGLVGVAGFGWRNVEPKLKHRNQRSRSGETGVRRRLMWTARRSVRITFLEGGALRLISSSL